MGVTAPILTGDEPLHDLQAAIVPMLKAYLDPTPVIDHVPEGTPTPYVLWSSAWLAERDTLNTTADRVWFQLDVWSDYRGYHEAIVIARRIVARLHHASVDMPGYDLVHVLREQTHELRDPDGTHRRVSLTFNCPYVSPLRRKTA
jgi:hypothetical protein